MKPVKNVFSSIFVSIFLLVSMNVFAQVERELVANEKKFDVEITNDTVLGAKFAQLDKAVYRQSEDLFETLKLSIALPFDNKSKINDAKVKLTAYNEKGNLYGMAIKSMTSSEGNYSDSKDIFSSNIEIDNRFEKASSFKLNIFDKNVGLFALMTCRECAELAKDTCGVGKVASVKCGNKDSGSCEFTCKPN
jgi:hypothetical protein